MNQSISKQFIAKKFQMMSAGLSMDADALNRFDDIIDLSIGDTDFVTDQRIIQKAFDDAKKGYTHYGSPKGDPELITAIQRQWNEDYQIPLAKEEILISASSCLGMSLTLFSILNPGEEVILLSPYFPPYKDQVELAGGVAVEVALDANNYYQINAEQIQKKITDKTKAIIFNNPCNPTGKVFSKEEIQSLIQIAQENQLLIISDEIYTDYVYKGEFTPVISIEGAKEYTITLNSFSKNYMMTGWRIGCIIGAPEILQVINQINGAMIYTSPAISQRAAIEAIRLRKEMREKYISNYQKRIELINRELKTIPFIDHIDSEGTFYAFPSIKKTGMNSKQFCEYLFEKAHILVSPGHLFGSSGEDHFRIACTVDVDILTKAMGRMRRLKF